LPQCDILLHRNNSSSNHHRKPKNPPARLPYCFPAGRRQHSRIRRQKPRNSIAYGAPEDIRTPDPQIRMLKLDLNTLAPSASKRSGPDCRAPGCMAPLTRWGARALVDLFQDTIGTLTPLGVEIFTLFRPRHRRGRARIGSGCRCLAGNKSPPHPLHRRRPGSPPSPCQDWPSATRPVP
jgi:hypothetical protein